MPAPSTTEDDSGDWDGDQGRQTAFCNSVNVRMEKVSCLQWMGWGKTNIFFEKKFHQE